MTPLFSITEWEQNQEQPHVTENRATRINEIMAQLIIQDRDLDSPPTSVDDGDAYYLNGAGADEWTGQADVLCLRVGTEWHFVTPRTGFRAWIADEAIFAIYQDGSSPDWVAYP